MTHIPHHSEYKKSIPLAAGLRPASNGVTPKILRSATAFALSFFCFASFASAAAGELNSPLNPSISSIPAFISTALKVLVMVALPIISLFIVYSGFMFVIARGNEGMLTEAKKNFFYVIVGSILILGAWVIATLIGGTVAQLTN